MRDLISTTESKVAKGSFNQSDPEWEKICREVAEALSFSEEEDPAIESPLISKEQKHEAVVLQTAADIDTKMKELQKQVENLGEILLQHTTTESEKEAILNLLKTIEDSLEQDQEPVVTVSNPVDLASALDLPKDTLELIEKVGALSLSSERWSDAIAIFTFLSIIQSSHSHHWFKRALAFYFSGAIEVAAASVELALMINSYQPEYWLLLAASSVDLGERDKAQAALAKVNELLTTYHLELAMDWQKWRDRLQHKMASK